MRTQGMYCNISIEGTTTVAVVQMSATSPKFQNDMIAVVSHTRMHTNLAWLLVSNFLSFPFLISNKSLIKFRHDWIDFCGDPYSSTAEFTTLRHRDEIYLCGPCTWTCLHVCRYVCMYVFTNTFGCCDALLV